MSNKAEGIKIKSKKLRGTLDDSLQNPITGSLFEDDQTVIKFHGIYQQDDRDRRDERAEKKLEPLYSFMIRLRIPGGKISAKQWVGANEIADQYSTGIIKVTTRQTIQLHGVIKSTLKPTVSWFDKYDLDSIAACGDVNRNIMSTATIAGSKAEDEVYEFSKKISEHLLPATNAYQEIWLDGEKVSTKEVEPIYGETYLPRKFKIVIAIPPDNDVDLYAHDVGLIAIIEDKKLKGFNVVVGGGMGNTHGNKETYPRIGNLIGYADKKDIIKVVEAIATTQRDYGNREDRKLSRFKYTVARLGVDFVKEEIEKRSVKLEPAKHFKFETRNDYYGWHQDYNNNYHNLIFVENGRILDDEKSQLKSALLEITKNNLSDIRFTSNQNVIISNIDPKNKEKVEKILEKYNVSDKGVSNIRKNAMACVALNTCPLALAEGQRYLPDLIGKFEILLKKHDISNNPVSVRMTGCPNGCARPFMAEIGFVGKAMGVYNMYIGGSATGERLNTLYKEDLNENEILENLDILFAQYVREKQENETFGDFSYKLIKN
ncbi:NADPH-dependent assimilatory sulfite reductase hemoprotein subunit [Rickettsiales bacterium]|nr:NADPH-dependent assimilatory sulfite reductase hemoprotein subunit [Rickettsiales bacterium]